MDISSCVWPDLRWHSMIPSLSFGLMEDFQFQDCSHSIQLGDDFKIGFGRVQLEFHYEIQILKTTTPRGKSVCKAE